MSPTVGTRSPELREFYADVLVTFAEGGIQMIGSVVDHVSADGWGYEAVTVAYGDEPATEHTITLDTIARAFSIVDKRDDVKHLEPATRARYRRARRELDAGQLDAADATNIVEIALFGEIVYG